MEGLMIGVLSNSLVVETWILIQIYYKVMEDGFVIDVLEYLETNEFFHTKMMILLCKLW